MPIYNKTPGMHSQMELKKHSPKRDIPRKAKKGLASMSELGAQSAEQEKKYASLKFDVNSIR
jgi:hypothetical protein